MLRNSARLSPGTFSPGTTGFLATLILSGAFMAVAFSIWSPKTLDRTAIAIDPAGVQAVAVMPADAATR